jgi:branched-chain amino acid transport system permease protein
VYNADVLMQLLVCYALVLMMDDVVKIVWGAEFQSMGMPDAFQAPPLFILGGIVPLFYVYLIGAAALIALVLWVILNHTLMGKIVRAAAQNPTMTSALGLNTSLIYAAVFAFGGALAGMAGGLAAPVRSMSPGMGFSILIESFIVTVIGGMGSVSGALVGALLIGLIRAFGTIGFPLFVEGLMFIAMGLILILRPNGLLGKEGRTA